MKTPLDGESRSAMRSAGAPLENDASKLPEDFDCSSPLSPPIVTHLRAGSLERNPLPIYVGVAILAFAALGWALAWESIGGALFTGSILVLAFAGIGMYLRRDRRHGAMLQALRGADVQTQLSSMTRLDSAGTTCAEMVRMLRQILRDGSPGLILRLVDLGHVRPIIVRFEPIPLQYCGARSRESAGGQEVPDESAARGMRHRLSRWIEIRGGGAIIVLIGVMIGLFALAVGWPEGLALAAVITFPAMVGVILQALMFTVKRHWWIANGVVFARAPWRGRARRYRRTDSVLAVYDDYTVPGSRICIALVGERLDDEIFATHREAEFVLNAWASPVPPPTDEMLEQWL